MLRRVVGDSMRPTLKPGQLIVGFKKRQAQVGNLVIVKHGHKEIVKRLAEVKGGEVYITGDNEAFSSDSREFGWVSENNVLATVIWPPKL